MLTLQRKVEDNSQKSIEVKQTGKFFCDFYVLFSHRIIKKKDKDYYHVKLVFDSKADEIPEYREMYPIFYLKNKKGLNQIECEEKNFYNDKVSKKIQVWSAKSNIATLDVPLDEITNNEFEIEISAITTWPFLSKEDEKSKTIVHFNTKPIVEKEHNGDFISYKFINFISFYVLDHKINRTYNGCYNVGSYDLRVKCLYHKGRLDYDLDITKSYNAILSPIVVTDESIEALIDYLNDKLSRSKFFGNELRLFEKGYYDDGFFNINQEITGGQNFYDIKKINYDIESRMDGYYIKNVNETGYDSKTKKIVDLAGGTSGILKNNLSKNSYIRTKITISDANFYLEVVPPNSDSLVDLRSTLKFDTINFKEIDLNYLKSEWDEIKKKTPEEYIDFIKENESTKTK